MLLHAPYIDVAIGGASGTLALPNHLAQAIHGFVVSGVQGVTAVGQHLYGLPNAAGLVNAALLADGQVHGQMEERIALTFIDLLHGSQGCIDIGQLCVVLRVIVNPQAGDGFYGFKGLSGV
jgi:hypothetical protein